MASTETTLNQPHLSKQDLATLVRIGQNSAAWLVFSGFRQQLAFVSCNWWTHPFSDPVWQERNQISTKCLLRPWTILYLSFKVPTSE